MSGFRNILQRRCPALPEIHCAVQVGYQHMHCIRQVANTSSRGWGYEHKLDVSTPIRRLRVSVALKGCLRDLRQRRTNFNPANHAASLRRQLEVSDSVNPCQAVHRLGATAFDTSYILGEFDPLKTLFSGDVSTLPSPQGHQARRNV